MGAAIYDIYIANHNRAMFWAVRDCWDDMFVQVQTIAGRSEGPLQGAPPYRHTVRADVWRVIGKPLKSISHGILGCPWTPSFELLGADDVADAFAEWQRRSR